MNNLYSDADEKSSMGSISSTPASGSSASVTSPISFTGISTYSSDFQAILQRQDAISQLPVTALQNRQADNLDKKQALIALNPVVSSLASSVAALGQLASGQGLTAASSDSSTVSVVNTGATSPGNYTVSNITVGTAASELSLSSYANATTTPIGVPGQNKFTLQVGSKTYNLDITGNDNLTGLQNAINASGAPVTASILNSGSASYLSITADSVGAATLTLKTNPQAANLISSTGSGTETSLASYPDTGTTAVSNSGIVNLSVGGGAAIPLDISANNNLTGLMNAINGAGAGVTASITSAGGQNRLRLIAAGGTAITLTDTPSATTTNLISNSNQGSNSSFTLNNSIQVTNQPTNVFSNIIPGVTFTLQKNNPGTVNLALSTNAGQLTSALQTFVNSYNALADQVTQQTGKGAGPLGADSTIRDISDDLRQLSGYFASSSSTVRSLSDLGITFDNTGHISLDSSVVSGFNSTQLADAFKFFGSSNSGFASFASNFTALSDPISGSIQTEEDGIDADNTNLATQISSLQDRAALVHNANTLRLEAADALVAQLQNNLTAVNAEVQSVNFVNFGKQTTTG